MLTRNRRLPHRLREACRQDLVDRGLIRHRFGRWSVPAAGLAVLHELAALQARVRLDAEALAGQPVAVLLVLDRETWPVLDGRINRDAGAGGRGSDSGAAWVLADGSDLDRLPDALGAFDRLGSLDAFDAVTTAVDGGVHSGGGDGGFPGAGDGGEGSGGDGGGGH
jgi:hypothetical protein